MKKRIIAQEIQVIEQANLGSHSNLTNTLQSVHRPLVQVSLLHQVYRLGHEIPEKQTSRLKDHNIKVNTAWRKMMI